MKLQPIVPPRIFRVGAEKNIAIQDCARIHMEPDEQVTMVAATGAEWDILRKDWGYYATPSLNGRLAASGLRTALVKNTAGKFFIFLVEAAKEKSFQAYIASENQRIIAWLDDEDELARLEKPGMAAGRDG